MVIAVALLAFLITSYIFFLKDLPVFPDEAIYYDMAKNLVSQGKLYPGLFPTTNQAILDSAIGVSPVYFYILGNWTKATGSSIEAVRSLSLILGIISLGIFYLIAKRLFNNPLLASIGVILLAVNIYFSRASRLGRPDILAFLILLSCLFTYIQWIKTAKIKYLILAGIFSAVAVITHPMGIINIAILGFSILFAQSQLKDKFSHLILVFIPLVAAIYWFLFVFNDFNSFTESIKFHIKNTTAQEPFLFILFKSSLAFTILFTVELAVIAGFLISLKRNFSKINLIILIGTLASIIITLNGRENFYILYFQPFIILCLLSMFDNFKKVGRFLGKTATLLAALYLLTNISIQFLFNDNLISSSINSQSYHKFSDQIKERLPKNQPLTIILIATPDPYFDLKDNPNYQFIEAALEIKQEYKTILDRGDYMVVNWVSNPTLQTYIEQNAQDINWVGSDTGYRAAVIKLKPRKERI